MKILDTTIGLGETQTIPLNIARLHTGTPIDIPVVVARGEQEGPCLLLTGGIHGDEINGVEIIRQIIAKGYHRPQRGTVICMPVINVLGFLNQSRDFPDGRDLNRMFPGVKKGSLASRFAYYIIKIISPHIDCCIDYHTGGAARFNYSQVRLDADNKGTLALANAFGTKFIIDSENRKKSFRKTLSELGKQVLLFEGGKTLHLDRSVTKVGIAGTLRVMQHLNMRDYSQELQEIKSPPFSSPICVKDSSWIRASHSGMWRTEARIGSYVEKGDIVGAISNPYGTFEKAVLATKSGYVICNNHAPIVNQGDAIIHITTELVDGF